MLVIINTFDIARVQRDVRNANCNHMDSLMPFSLRNSLNIKLHFGGKQNHVAKFYEQFQQLNLGL